MMPAPNWRVAPEAKSSCLLASALAFQHSHSCSLPQQRHGDSLQRRSITHQNELQQPKTYMSIRIHPSTHAPLSSFKTRQAVRRCALPVQTVRAIWNSILMPSTSAYVPVLPRCVVVGRLRSLILAKCGEVHFHCSIRLRCAAAHLVNPIGAHNTVEAANHSFHLQPSFRWWSRGLRTSYQPMSVGTIGPGN